MSDTNPIEVAWHGLDDPDRLDVASFDFTDGGGFVATGRQSTPDYRAQWDLIVDGNWRTKMVTVEVEGFADGSEESAWSRQLTLWRRDAGGRSTWRCETDESGDVPRHFAPMGIADGEEDLFADAVDVDLAHCPVTNTMPIRRLNLTGPDAHPHDLVMAWISLPDLTVHAAQQVYAPASDGSALLANTLDERVADVVRYRSLTRGVEVELSVDANGIVVTYPDLATRLSLD